MPPLNRPRLSADEIIATLNHSSLPTVLVEGGDDVIIYRRLEQRNGFLSLSVMPAEGRENIISVFSRRRELTAAPIVFVADRDCWVIDGVPAEYQHDHLLFTDGYSIENDAIRDRDFEALMLPNEQTSFQAELELFIRWYALAFQRREDYAMHPTAVLDNQPLMNQMMILKQQEVYPDQLANSISEDYLRLLRGKSLLALIVRKLSYPGRTPRHNGQSLLEIAAVAPGTLLNALFDRISQALLTQAPGA